MKISKILLHNYKLFKDEVIHVNPDYNIFVGNNDSGKSTLLEAIQTVISGKLNNYSFERQLKASCFNQQIRDEFRKKLDQKNIDELPKIIYAWIKKFTPIKTEDGDTVTADEIAKMKKQMLKLQEENEILKKAMAIFAKK